MWTISKFVKKIMLNVSQMTFKKNNTMQKFKYLFALVLFSMLFVQCDPDEPITDITQFPRLKVADASALEASGTLSVPVTLTWAYTQVVEVDYKVIELEEASAENGSDFITSTGTLVFEVGETEKSINIELLDDVLSEANEKFQVELIKPKLGRLLDAIAICTITDDDGIFVIDDAGYEAPEQYQGFTRVWEDDFESSVLDAEVWTHELGGHGWGNNELQHYTDRPANCFQAGGYLVIEAKEEAYSGNDYTSARLVSLNKFEFQYGRVDFRAKLPEGKGIWPALWMMGQDFPEVGWPKCGEIDIMELIGSQAQIVHGTAHFPDANGQRDFRGASTFLPGAVKFSEEFHVFSILWRENKIEWLVDGNSFFVLEPDDLDGGEWPYNDAFFFIMNVAVGGDWPGSPNATTVFPQRMIVDYVRLYQS